MPKRNLIIVIVLVIVIGAGAVAWLLKGNSMNNTPSNTTGSTSSTSGANDSSQGTVITYSDSGFSPSTVTVKSGTTITIKNTSSQNVQFDSDPHPVHTDDPELNVGEISPGQSGTVKAITKGTHGYHNHLNPAQTGTIVVE